MESWPCSTRSINSLCDKKKLCFFLFLLFLVSLVNCSTAPSTQQTKAAANAEIAREKLRQNKVKTATVWVQRFQSGVPFGPRIKESTKIYDRDGMEIELYAYLSDDIVGIHNTTTYDASGKEIKTIRQYGADTDMVFYYYGKPNQRLEKIEQKTLDGTLKVADVYRYDDHGRVVELVSYDGSGNKKGSVTYKHNSSGSPVEITEFGQDGQWQARKRYTYNDLGNAGEEIAEYPTPGSGARITYSYDATESLIEKTQYHPDGTLWVKTRYTYDSRGLMIELLELDSNGRLQSRSQVEYKLYP